MHISGTGIPIFATWYFFCYIAYSIFTENFIINIHFCDYSDCNKLFYAEENQTWIIIPIFCILSKVIYKKIKNNCPIGGIDTSRKYSI